MDPLIIALGFMGIWGSMILGTILKRSLKRLESNSDQPSFEELREATQQLEARLQQVEEELTFFRELNGPEPPAQLG